MGWHCPSERRPRGFRKPNAHYHGRMILYGIPNCDTVKRARAWLSERGLPHEFHDFKKQGVPAERLDAWIAQVGWDTLLNRKGATWRKLDVAAQNGVRDANSAKALMLANPSVIKRPVVEWSGKTTVGFDATQWALLAGR
jgi:Spx/MgsR family transcriptional regulator